MSLDLSCLSNVNGSPAMHSTCFQVEKSSKTARCHGVKTTEDIKDWELVHETVAGLADWVLLLQSSQRDSRWTVESSPRVKNLQPIIPPEKTDLQNITLDMPESVEMNELTRFQRFAEKMRSRQQEEEETLDRMNDQVMALIRDAQLALVTEVEVLSQNTLSL